MSTLDDNVPTNTSEDFGFKSLGRKNILPSSNERLPFASLNHLSISNSKSLFTAYSGDKFVIGDLQKVRDYIVYDGEGEETPQLTFLLEKDIPNVIECSFDINDNICIVTRTGSILSVNSIELSEPQELLNINRRIKQVKVYHNLVWILDEESELMSYDINLNQKTVFSITQVASFDVFEDQLFCLLQDGDDVIQIYKGEGNPVLFKAFSNPQDMNDAFDDDDLSPISISALNKSEFLMVYGNKLDGTEYEDAMYDQKMYIAKYHQVNQTLSFHESFDITPPYGSVLRYPYFYDILLRNLVDGCDYINIIGSSNASELTIYDSKEVVQPLQDSERAVLPINQNTDNDTNPTGLALDISTKGHISEICPGIDSIEQLPLIYILNNEGDIQIVGLYHASAIKENKFHIDNVRIYESENKKSFSSTSSEQSKIEEVAEDSTLKLNFNENKSVDANKSDIPNPFASAQGTSSPFSQLSFGGKVADTIETSSIESKPFSFGMASTNTNESNTTSFGIPTFGQKAEGSGLPAFGSSAFGKPAFGSSDEISKAAFGTPAFGAPKFGQPTESPQKSTELEKPAFGTATFGKSLLGTTKANTESQRTSAFGAPMFEKNTETKTENSGQETTSKPLFGQLGNSTGEMSQPAVFGKAAFGSAESSIINKPLFGTVDNASFGKPDFGSAESSITNKPLFGSAENSSFGKSAFGQATFGQSTFGSLSSNIGKTESPFMNLDKQESPFTNINAQKSPFANIGNKESPFGRIQNNTISKSSKPLFNIQKKDTPTESESEEEDLSDQESSDEKEDSIDNLGDSTVEATPFDLNALDISKDESIESKDTAKESENDGTKLSIASLADRIKKSANMSAQGLSFSELGNSISNDISKTTSPFSSFTNKLTEPSKAFTSFSMEDNPAFSFNKASNRVQETGNDDIEEPSTRIEHRKEQESDESEESEESQVEHEIEEPETEAESEHDGFVIDGVNSSTINDSEDIEEGSEENEESEESEEIIEDESFDDLKDISRKEFEDVLKTDDNTMSLVDEGVGTGFDVVRTEIQTEIPETVHVSAQVTPDVCSTECQTDSKIMCDFEMQSFEQGENYLAEVYKPKPLQPYYTNAIVGNIPILSSEPTLVAIEKTYQLIEGELMVLEENIINMDMFFKDQCTIGVENRTKESLPNIYTWKISESNKLQEIFSELSNDYSTQNMSCSELSEKVATFTVDLLKTKEQINEIKELVSQFEYLADLELDDMYRDLSLHQSKMQTRVRQKMSNVFAELNKIEELMNILKIYVTKDKRLNENALVKKLNFEKGNFINILENIKNVQRGIEELKISTKQSISLSDAIEENGYNIVKEEIKSEEVVEYGLKINTKKQLGNFFKNIKH